MLNLESLELPKLGLRGLEAGLNEEELAIQNGAHRFVAEVMRPIGETLFQWGYMDMRSAKINCVGLTGNI